MSQPATGAASAAVSDPFAVPAQTGAILNVADAIAHVLLPQLQGSAQARAKECVTILARVLQSRERYPQGPAVAASAANAGLDAVLADLAALRADDARTRELEAQIGASAAGAVRHFDATRFEHYLRSHALGGAATTITASRQLAGGRSKQTILVTQRGAAALPEELIVRQDWASAVTGTTVVSEYALLRRVWEAGIKVPQPLLLEAGSEALGAPFIVVSRLPGGGQGDLFNPPRSEALALQIAAELGRLHALPVDDFEALGVATEAYRSEQLRAGLAGFRQLHAQLGPQWATLTVAMDWLERQIEHVDGPRAILHNDLGCHNLLIEGEDLRAFLDWELAHIGNPGADLGYIRGWVEKMTDWDRFMAVYHAAGGPPISALTLDFYTIWTGVRLYGLLIQARAGVASGVVRDTEITYAATEFFAQQLEHIAVQLARVLERHP